MAFGLWNKRTAVLTAALAVAGATTFLVAGSKSTSQPKDVKWDEKESAEVARSLHEMHENWNKGDMEAVRKVIAGDDVLVTFELGPDNKTPVPLRSRDEILAFMSKVELDTANVGTSFEMEMPKMNCRATSSFGICTEECTVHLKKNGSTTRIDKLFGTSIAVKYADGWKWIQWHMSVGLPAAPVTTTQNLSPTKHHTH
ncbi:hypothetical protein F183_A28220 [Bryobacterales bacterium F-183]|nr:hypothetical protein F183_A28220 [Bryobacterales bacterium F-183]